MKIVGDPDPALSDDLGGVHVENNDVCDHEPEYWEFDEKHQAFLVGVCEHCGAALLAEEIDEELLADSGEISVTSYTVEE